MDIWVDADACPKVIKEILFRAAERAKVRVTLIANHALRTPPSDYVSAVQVSGGFDVADEQILARINPGDLVVTADIPLAAAVIEKRAHALNPRGERYTEDTVRQRLVMRDLMDELRGSGIQTGGPPPIGPRERKAFADELDRLLTTLTRD
ncbi:MAG: YaiI/YqxD family protein [Chromatiales bacterium]|jgi:uncharacterized protein YaiI (UPF0178 family)